MLLLHKLTERPGILVLCPLELAQRQNRKIYYHNENTEMESNNELKEIDIKNCIWFCFDHIININDLDLDKILDEKSYKTF